MCVTNASEVLTLLAEAEHTKSDTIDVTDGSIKQLPLLAAQLPREHNAT